MARPKDPDKRIGLALQAIEILEREGVEISVEQLASEMGIKRPTLLYHFPSYGSIAEEAIKHYLAEASAFVTGRLAQVVHPIDRVYAHLLAVTDFQRGKEARFAFLTQVIASTAGRRMRQVAQATAMYFEVHRASMVRLLQEGIKHGTVAPCDPSAIIMMVRAINDGTLIQRVATKTDSAAVHELLWSSVLAPLRLEPGTAKRAKASLPRARPAAKVAVQAAVAKTPRPSTRATAKRATASPRVARDARG